MLTSRQQQIAVRIAMGHTDRKIADELFISPATVKTHRTQLMHRLGVHKAAQVACYVAQEGWLA